MTLEAFWNHRFAALADGDYEAVYNSYHPDAPFLQNFSDAEEYRAFAATQLRHIEVRQWQVKKVRTVAADQVECLLIMELVIDGTPQYFYELALVKLVDKRWLYHSAQKLSSEDYPGDPERIDFSDFDQVQQKIRF